MAVNTDAKQPADPGAQTQPDPTASSQPSAEAGTATSGSTGEGAASAMVRLISQEQARLFPASPEDTSADSS